MKAVVVKEIARSCGVCSLDSLSEPIAEYRGNHFGEASMHYVIEHKPPCAEDAIRLVFVALGPPPYLTTQPSR